MEIWIVNPYGTLPGESWREYRSTMIAQALIAHGHQVIWWVSNFEHRSKCFRSEGWKDIQVTKDFIIRIVPSTSYKAHISFARIRYERRFVKNFKHCALDSKNKPDIIICAEPALFSSDCVVEVCRKKKAKLIIDILDLWPELFDIILPKRIRFLGKLILYPLYLRRNWFFKQADAIIAVSRDYLALGTKSNKSALAEIVYVGVDVNSISKVVSNGFQGEKLKILHKHPGELWVIYAGTFGDNYDLRTIMQCATMIEASGKNIKLILAGDGVLRTYIENFIDSNTLTKTIYVGNLNSEDLNLLYKDCNIGLSSYVEGSTVSMPIKAYDYFSAGLPLINSLKRDLGKYIIEYNAGIQCQPENARQMYNAVMKFYNNPKLLLEMKNNALKLAMSFNKDTQYQKVVTLCENLIVD